MLPGPGGRRVIWRGAAQDATLGAAAPVSRITPREESTMATKKKATRPARKPARPKRPPRQQPEALRVRSIAAAVTRNDPQKSVARYPGAPGVTPGGRGGA